MRRFIEIAHTVDELINILSNYRDCDIELLGTDELCYGVEVYVDDELKTISLG